MKQKNDKPTKHDIKHTQIRKTQMEKESTKKILQPRQMEIHHNIQILLPKHTRNPNTTIRIKVERQNHSLHNQTNNTTTLQKLQNKI